MEERTPVFVYKPRAGHARILRPSRLPRLICVAYSECTGMFLDLLNDDRSGTVFVNPGELTDGA